MDAEAPADVDGLPAGKAGEACARCVQCTAVTVRQNQQLNLQLTYLLTYS
jgi:hypothetical protein